MTNGDLALLQKEIEDLKKENGRLHEQIRKTWEASGDGPSWLGLELHEAIGILKDKLDRARMLLDEKSK